MLRGWRAGFYTKLCNRRLRPLLEAGKPPSPTEAGRAPTTLENTVNAYVKTAGLTPTA